MSDAEVPEADALEQAEAVEPDGAGGAAAPSPAGLEAPEADAIEQSVPVRAGGGAPAPTVGFEVPAADALEQAVEVGEDDDHDHDR